MPLCSAGPPPPARARFSSSCSNGSGSPPRAEIGIAGAAFVAYLSGIVSKRFTAVQYALLSSLTFLIGGLGRGIAGEAFDIYGYATVFRWTAAAGACAVLFVVLEWFRVAAEGRDRDRRRRFRCVSLRHRQQALHRGAICAAVIADLPHRRLGARDRR